MTTRPIAWFVAHVTDQLGAHEKPLGSNNTAYGRRFGWNRVAWCAEFGWDMYADAGVALPIKSASCVAIYDYCVRNDLRYDSNHCVPGDAVIRTWQRFPRNAPGFNPAETHFQIVVQVKDENGRKQLGLIGGNQGAGYVGPGIEWVTAGDASILGGLAFHRLFHTKQSKPAVHDPTHDRTAGLPAKKSHPHVVADPPPKRRVSGRAQRRMSALVYRWFHRW